MNLLHRVFYGRVAKPRPAANDQHQGNKPKASSWSPTRSRPAHSSSPRGDSMISIPKIPRLPSAQNGQSCQIAAASMPTIRIKEEDEVDAGTMFSAKGDHMDFMINTGQPDGHTATSGKSSRVASPVATAKEESSGGDSFEEHSNEVASSDRGSRNGNEVESNEDVTADEELNATGADYFNSDEPIASIEEDDGDLEVDAQPRQKTPLFLHGMAHRPERAPGSNSEDGLNKEIEDEDFEEELRGEVEESLLIEDNDLRYWLRHKRSTAGIQNWPSEARRLYKLLFLRGLYPMFGSQWTWNFLDHPLPGELFTPLGSDDKCLLKAEKSDYHASKALIRLFNLHGYVNDHRRYGSQEKIAPLIKKEIKRYVLWAERDGDFVKKHDYVSPVSVITYKDTQAASTGQHIVERCQALVQRYRSRYAARGIRDYPRCIFIFVVVQHIVVIMVGDTEHLDEEEPYPLAELDLSKRSHWLDYSLGIAITVMLARESLLAHRWAFPTIQVVEDDPDL